MKGKYTTSGYNVMRFFLLDWKAWGFTDKEIVNSIADSMRWDRKKLLELHLNSKMEGK